MAATLVYNIDELPRRKDFAHRGIETKAQILRRSAIWVVGQNLATGNTEIMSQL